MKPVVIVGAGLAGLTCARALKRQRIPFLILEGSDRIGGKLKSETVHGHILDEGYQLYFAGYPTAKDQIDAEKLHLRQFGDGTTILWDGDQHVVSRENPIPFILSSLIPNSDKLRLAKWTSDVGWMDQEDIWEMPDQPAKEYFQQEGFSGEFIDRFASPFFGSILLDRSLSLSCRQLVFVWKAMNEGISGIPELGMEEIPKQIGATFGPEQLRVNATVSELVFKGDHVVGVKLSSGEVVDTDNVVLACNPDIASKLSGIAIDVEYQSTITLYFEANPLPARERWVVSNGNMRGITSHVASLTQPLVAAVIVGTRAESDEQLADIVRAEMRLWFPKSDPESWKFLKGYRRETQMFQNSGFQSKLPGNSTDIDGLFFAGEFTTNSSIDGAIRSGVDCAATIAEHVEASVV